MKCTVWTTVWVGWIEDVRIWADAAISVAIRASRSSNSSVAYQRMSVSTHCAIDVQMQQNRSHGRGAWKHPKSADRLRLMP